MVLEAVVEKLKFFRKEPLQTVSQVAPAQLDDCLERVVKWIETRFGKQYFVQPLETFSQEFGKAFPEDAFYQERMNYFLEYCILERPIKGQSSLMTPLRMFFDEITGQSVLYPEPWVIFSEFRHSLFEVTKAGENQIQLRDLLSERKYTVRSKCGETLKYLRKKTIFQSYLFGSNGIYYLGQGVVTHPDRARKPLVRYIRSLVKANQMNEMRVLKLASLNNMRYLRMQHVDPAKLYRQYLV